jgi:hypothetical protein
MKTILMIGSLLVGLSCLPLHGQNVMVFGAVNSTVASAPNGQSGGSPTVVVNVTPVACQTPVVIYRPVSPNVIYVGGGCGYPRPNYYSGGCYGPGSGGWAWDYAPPNVIPFGMGQGYLHGYHFRHCR